MIRENRFSGVGILLAETKTNLIKLLAENWLHARKEFSERSPEILQIALTNACC
jgi:hypothetical protein